MFTFLHAADIHLDSPLRGLEGYPDAPVDRIRRASRRALENLVDLAIEERVAFVLLVGDLYDGDWKDYNTGLFFVRVMSRLRKEGIRVFLVSGNHDAASQISKSLSLPDNVHSFSTKKPESLLLDDLMVVIHGRGYPSRVVSDNLALEYPCPDPHCFNIGMLHTSLTGRAEHDSYAPCNLDDLRARGYDYWALGHVHCREELSRDPWVVFPGNLQGRHIREVGAKGASLVRVVDGKVSQVEHRCLDVVRWALCQVDLADCESLEMAFDRIRRGLEQEQVGADGRVLALRLELYGETPIHPLLHRDSAALTEGARAIAEDLGDIWLEKLRLMTRQPVLAVPTQATATDQTPMDDLDAAIACIGSDATTLFDLVPDLIGLKSKLPPELLHDPDFVLADTGLALEEIRQSVRDLLWARLLGAGDSR